MPATWWRGVMVHAIRGPGAPHVENPVERSFFMLTLTENAAAVIRTITGQEDMPAGTGLRIASNEDGALNLNLSPEPEAGDQVLDDSGVRLFLDAEAAVMRDDKALDAAVDPDGSVQFALAEQAD